MDKGVERIYPNGEGNMDFSNVVRMVKKMLTTVLVRLTFTVWLR